MSFIRVKNPYRFLNGGLGILFLIGLLCVGITLQILGASLSFWDLDGSSDPIESSLLEGFSIVSMQPVLWTIGQFLIRLNTGGPIYQFLAEDLFFRPPIPIV